MNVVEIGLLTSVLLLVFSVTLFRFESTRKLRFIDGVRTRLDFLVLRLLHKLHIVTQVYLKRFLRRFGHFLVHSVLAGILSLVRLFEQRITHFMRINRTRAVRGEKKSNERNKLEEIALHKLEVSLTDEEKQKRKDIELQG